MEGGGRMLVTAVGPYSQQGIIFQLLTSRDEEDVGFIERFFREKVRVAMNCPAAVLKSLSYK